MLNTQNKIWNATLYLRLSRDDGDKEESNSITGQRELLRDYISQRPEFREYAVRVDDGYSGSTFERPSFQKMIEDVKAGRTDCIVVKDLSRFGRNYKETGNYLERIFPFLGVRFIAVNDNFDTLTAERTQNGYIVPLKNLINEVYSKDISKKSASALHVKQQNGELIGAWAPYGYRKDPDNKHHLVINEETAQRFDRYSSGVPRVSALFRSGAGSTMPVFFLRLPTYTKRAKLKRKNIRVCRGIRKS